MNPHHYLSPADAKLKAHEYNLRARSTRISRLKAALADAEGRAAAVNSASFQAQLAQLRHMEFDDARKALKG